MTVFIFYDILIMGGLPKTEEREVKQMATSKTMGIIKFVPALQYAFPEIKRAYYYIDKGTSEEWVHIHWKSDHSPIEYDFEVCVTCDSVPAMYDDVWKECKRRFG